MSYYEQSYYEDVDYSPYNYGHPIEMDEKLKKIECKLMDFLDAYYLPEPIEFSKSECLDTISDIMKILEISYRDVTGKWKTEV